MLLHGLPECLSDTINQSFFGWCEIRDSGWRCWIINDPYSVSGIQHLKHILHFLLRIRLRNFSFKPNSYLLINLFFEFISYFGNIHFIQHIRHNEILLKIFYRIFFSPFIKQFFGNILGTAGFFMSPHTECHTFDQVRSSVTNAIISYSLHRIIYR